MQYENLKNKEIAGQFLIKTTPVWLSERRVLMVCDAINKTDHKEVTIILSDVNKDDHERLFHIARQDKDVHVLQAGMTKEEKLRFIAIDKVGDVRIKQVEGKFIDKQSDKETVKEQPFAIPEEAKALPQKIAMPIWGWYVFAALLIVIFILLAIVVAPILEPVISTPTPTITPTITSTPTYVLPTQTPLP